MDPLFVHVTIWTRFRDRHQFKSLPVFLSTSLNLKSEYQIAVKII